MPRGAEGGGDEGSTAGKQGAQAAFERRRARCVRLLLLHGANPADCGGERTASVVVHAEVQACLAELQACRTELRAREAMPLQLRELIVELAAMHAR